MKLPEKIVMFLMILAALIPVTWWASPENAGFTVSLACASTNLYASIRLKQLQDSKDERKLVSCWKCPDLQIAGYALGIKGIFGLGTMGGFMISKTSVASSGVACSSPVMITYLWAEGRAKISFILVVSAWITTGIVIFNAMMKEPWESEPSWEEWSSEDLYLKVIFVLIWTFVAWKLTKNVDFIGNGIMGVSTTDIDIAVFGCIVAYMLFSISSSLAFTYGMLFRHSTLLASTTWVILLALLWSGKKFTEVILVVERNPAALLIFSFAPSWFPTSHAIFNLFFLSQWREFHSLDDIFNFFGPLCLLLVASYVNVYLYQLPWTSGELPPAFYHPTEFWRWGTERLKNGNNSTARKQKAIVKDDSVIVELGNMTVADRALSPRSAQIMNKVLEARKPKSFNFSFE